MLTVITYTLTSQVAQSDFLTFVSALEKSIIKVVQLHQDERRTHHLEATSALITYTV
jgi:hypothetical protein